MEQHVFLHSVVVTWRSVNAWWTEFTFRALNLSVMRNPCFYHRHFNTSTSLLSFFGVSALTPVTYEKSYLGKWWLRFLGPNITKMGPPTALSAGPKQLSRPRAYFRCHRNRQFDPSSDEAALSQLLKVLHCWSYVCTKLSNAVVVRLKTRNHALTDTHAIRSSTLFQASFTVACAAEPTEYYPHTKLRERIPPFMATTKPCYPLPAARCPLTRRVYPSKY